MLCPECNNEVDDNLSICPHCGFDLALYNKFFDRIYATKLNQLNKENNFSTLDGDTAAVPRCPYCGSSDLDRITSIEKVANIALFGLFGNKRRYQWHCNNCKTDF